MNMFLNIAKIQNESMKFQATFNTLKSNYQNSFMLDNEDTNKHTIKRLTYLRIKNFKQLISKYDFDLSLRCIQRKLFVYYIII